MSARVTLFIVTAVLLPLALNELGDWAPWLARRVAQWTARRLGDRSMAERYEEEWLAELAEVPGKLACLAIAMGYLAALPRMRWSLRGQVSSRPSLEQLLPLGLPRSYPASVNHLYASQYSAAMELLARIIHDERQGKWGSRYAIVGPNGVGKTVTAAVIVEQMRCNDLRVVATWAPRWHADPATFRQWAQHLDQALGEDTLLVVDDATETTVRLVEQLDLRCSVLVTARCASPGEVPEGSHIIKLRPDISFLYSEWVAPGSES